MKKYISLLFILIFVCCGCTAKYELKFNSDMTIEQTITGLESDKFYNQFSSSNSDIVKMIMSPYYDYFSLNSYYYDDLEMNNLYGGYVKKTYDSLDDLSSIYNFYKMYFEHIDINQNDGVVSINLFGKKIDDDFSNRFIVDDGEISIIVPFKVLKHNADRVEDNKYIWKFDLTDKTKNSISIEFDSKNKISKSFVTSYIIIFLLLIIFSSFFIFRRFKVLKANVNKI